MADTKQLTTALIFVLVTLYSCIIAENCQVTQIYYLLTRYKSHMFLKLTKIQPYFEEIAGGLNLAFFFGDNMTDTTIDHKVYIDTNVMYY